MRSSSPLVAVVFTALLTTGLTLHAASRRTPMTPLLPPVVTEEQAPPEPAPVSTHTELPPPPSLPLDLELDPPDEARTPLPSKAEWAAALKFDLRHGRSCIGQRIREWVRVDCEVQGIQHVAAYAGETRDVHVGVRRVSYGTWEQDEGAVMMFPVRRGERRVIAATSAFFGRYSGGVPESGLLVSVSWPKRERAPTLQID